MSLFDKLFGGSDAGKRRDKQLDRIEQNTKTIMAKLTELQGTVEQMKAQAVKSFGEIRARVDELTAKIEELMKQIGDTDIPAGAQTALDELKVALQQLDDVVPDAPPPAP